MGLCSTATRTTEDERRSDIKLHHRSVIELPILITESNKIWLGCILFLVAAALYMFSNHNPIFRPQYLPMTWLDRTVPFIPETVWIYTSEYLFFIVAYLICKDRVNLNKYVYSMLALQVTSVVIFTLWPTIYPRELYPLPSDLDPATHWLFSTLREGDSPLNCAPSLHVSSVYLCTFLFLQEQREKFWFIFCWGTAIALSTLTTKQHYLIDVITGLGMALLFHRIFYHWATYKEPSRRFADYLRRFSELKLK